jgi:hypothetical protein
MIGNKNIAYLGNNFLLDFIRSLGYGMSIVDLTVNISQ